MVPWAQASLPQRHLDRFSRVCMAHVYDQHTVTQTTEHQGTHGNIPRLVLRAAMRASTGPDLSVWRPWAGSLLDAPTHPQML